MGIICALLKGEEGAINTSDNWRAINTSDSWQIALLVASSVNVCLVSIYWLYLIYISYMRTTKWRPPLLPHTLLLGLLLAAVAGFPHLTPDNPIACQGARLTTSLAYTIVYSSLLVRLVCLRSLHRGIFLPIPYQALLLLFCILVQVAMSVQWYVEDRSNCRLVSPLPQLLSTLYPLVLFLFVLALATLSRKGREHYNEAKWIWSTLVCQLPVWIAWTSAAVVLDQHFNVICGLGLQGFVLSTLVILVLPRSRYLTRLSRDGYNKFENDPYSYQSDSGFGYGSKGSWEPSFRSSKEGSYLGFHRPTRVVPPTPSSLSHSTFAPGLIYPDRFSYFLPPPPPLKRPHFPSAVLHPPPPSRSKYAPFQTYQIPGPRDHQIPGPRDHQIPRPRDHQIPGPRDHRRGRKDQFYRDNGNPADYYF